MSDHFPPQGDPPGKIRPEYSREGPALSDPGQRRIQVKLPTAKPLVTYILLGFTIFVYLLQMGSELMVGVDIPAYFGAKVNELIAMGQLWRLVTPMFLHGSILHIGFNMYALYIFGPRLERHFGHWRFLTLYLLSGVAGNVISMMFTSAPSLGSSTAIFGLLGAQGVFLYQNREIFGGIGRQALNSIIGVALVNLFIGLSPGIDNWGHIGGLLGGILFSWAGGPLLAVEGLFPNLTMVDKRSSGDVIRAGVIVGTFFAILTAGALILGN
jgi:rhomboid protease GluP